ncbi:hypothetical protein K440DRAFT_665410 [Wilcoxina mikolae CBS 423.85]|nr:hypothetical protein K440DRAFT_665410 [Wilcoxina mikolae CBS 423.85]
MEPQPPQSPSQPPPPQQEQEHNLPSGSGSASAAATTESTASADAIPPTPSTPSRRISSPPSDSLRQSDASTSRASLSSLPPDTPMRRNSNSVRGSAGESSNTIRPETDLFDELEGHTFTNIEGFLTLFPMSSEISDVFTHANSSALFDIHEEPEVFLRFMCRYAAMDAEDLGFDPTIRWHMMATPAEPFVHVSFPQELEERPLTATTPEKQYRKVKLVIFPKPLASNSYAIVGRASTCWKARLAEDESLDEGDSQADSQASMAPITDDQWKYVIKDQWRASNRDPEGIFYKFLANNRDQSCRLSKYHCHPELTDDQGKIIDTSTYVRKGLNLPATSTDTSPSNSRSKGSKRSRSADVASNSTKKHKRSIGQGSALSRQTKQNTVHNRIHTRLVTSPVGHRYLYNHGILHRDVSSNNILLLPSTTSSGHGFLIDLDLAVFLNRTAVSGTRHRTGTTTSWRSKFLSSRLQFTPLNTTSKASSTCLSGRVYFTPH